jgi:hypothetical protein
LIGARKSLLIEKDLTISPTVKESAAHTGAYKMPGAAVPPYGTAIHHAIARGELAEMKRVAREAEEFLAAHGDVRAALEILKVEIHKLEQREGK